MKEKMVSEIAQVTIRITGVWNDQEGNPYIHEKEFVLQIDTQDIKTFDQFNTMAKDVAFSMVDHPRVGSALMEKE